jgi:O-antigen/teichoic acid export membrane protein
MAEQSLKDKTVKGTFWSALDAVFKYGVSFMVGIVLARLLTPDDYGLIGILTIFISLFNVIVDGGFTNAIIRKQNTTNEDYCTVFYTNLTVSILLAGVLFLCARPISVFFERPELVALTQAMSPVVLINALAIVQKARLTKRIDFKTQTKITVISATLSGFIGIGMALLGCGVWSLVGQQLSNYCINTLLLWYFNKWWPKFVFSWDSFKDLWSFGWKLVASGILGAITDELNHAVIGKYYSPASLGQYTRARQFGNLLSHNVTTIVSRVSFPVLSAIQDEKQHLKAGYKRVIKTTMLPTFVCMLMLAAISRPLILSLVGEQWEMATTILPIICFILMLHPLHALNLNAIQVCGRSDLTLKLKIIKSVLAFIPIIFGIYFDSIYWLLWGGVVVGFLCYYLNAYYSKELLNYPVSEQLKDVLPSFSVAVGIALPVYLIIFIPLAYYILLPIQILVGGTLALIINEKVKLPEYLELKRILRDAIAKVKKKNN